MVPVRTAVPVRAVVREQIAGPFGSPIVPSDRAVRTCSPTVLSYRAIRRFRPCRSPVPASRRRGFRRVLG
jgi:hypothetical protein